MGHKTQSSRLIRALFLTLLITLLQRTLSAPLHLKNHHKSQKFRQFIESTAQFQGDKASMLRYYIDANKNPLRSAHASLRYQEPENLYIVQFADKIRPETHQAMRQKYSVALEHYIPENAFMVLMHDNVARDMLLDDLVFRVAPYTKEMKFGWGFDEAAMPWKEVSKNRPVAPGIEVEAAGGGSAVVQEQTAEENTAAAASPMFALALSFMKHSDITHEARINPKRYDAHQAGWLQALKSLVSSEDLHYDVIEGSNRVIFSSTDEALLKRIAAEAAEHPHVYWIERYEQDMQAELKFSRPATHTGTLDATSFVSRGLTGKGQFIGITDSGVDVNSCFFHDSEVAVPFVNSMSEEEPNKSHRKIASYWALLDKADVDHGHGTHVSSIALGKAAEPGPLAEWNGIASDAKLVFLDVGCSTPGGCSCTGIDGCPCRNRVDGKCPPNAGTMYIPSDFGKYVLGYHYSRGGKISSFSFGSASNIMTGYTSSSADIDNYVYNNPDHLILFSAGNSGSINGFSTLTGPTKETKNTIIVGAETAPIESWKDIYTNRLDYEEVALNVANEWYQSNLCGLYRYVPGHNETTSCYIAKEVAFAENPASMCCAALAQCRLSTQEYFATALERVESLLDKTCCMACAQKLIDISPWWRKGSLASFSSIGPAIDGRIKPDLLAIGNRVQAGDSNTGTCTADKAADVDRNIRASQGTSMSAPTAAGAAAVVRQYFEDGFYPGGKSNKDNAFNPSAALVKAVLIDCSRPLPNYLRVTTSGVITPGEMSFSQRRHHEGFGSINLQNTLQLDGESQHTLFVSSSRSLSTGQQHVFTLRIPDEPKYESLSVTLVWTDPAASETASFALVNDLDLIVVSQVNDKFTEWRGNCDTEEDNSSNVHDNANNVEKIHFKKVTPGATYKIFVRGDKVTTEKPQDYALVVTHGGVMENTVEESLYISKHVSSIFHLTSGVMLFAFTILLLMLLCTCGVLNLVSWVLVLLFSRRGSAASMAKKAELYQPFTQG